MEEDKISQCKYWLLDSALYRIIHTSSVIPNNFCDGVEVPPFGAIFSVDEVTTSLIELFNDGYLLAATDRPIELNSFIPSQSQIEMATRTKNDMNYDNGFYFYLTKKGGKKWESLSKPKWDTYTQMRGGHELEEGSGIYEAIFIAKQLPWLRKRISNLLGDPDENIYNYMYPHVIESRILTIVPYQPIYWKNLGRCYGCQIKFRLTDKKNIDKKTLMYHRANMIPVNGSRLEIYWYTHPYDEFSALVKDRLRRMGHDI
jgi:hypothetical protein